MCRFLTADDLSKQLFRRIAEERGTAHQELIQNDPHGPPVHWLAVALPENHLRGNVLGSATHLASRGGQRVSTKQYTQQLYSRNLVAHGYV